MVYEITGGRWRGTGKEEGQRLIWNSSNMVSLCVDTCDEKRQCGRLYHMYTKEPVRFMSLLQALSQMNELYDELQFPQASTVLRSFQRDQKTAQASEDRDPDSQRKGMRKMEEFEKVIEHRGERATFLIRVQYRQHSSWQGEVVWVDQQKKEYFRSALELVKLLDSALGTEEKIDAE